MRTSLHGTSSHSHDAAEHHVPMIAPQTLPICTGGSAREDASLPSYLPHHQHYLVAANLKNNEPLMPHYIMQLLKALLPSEHGTVFVSVYESGSFDATPQWVALLELVMRTAGIPVHAVAGGACRCVSYRLDLRRHVLLCSG